MRAYSVLFATVTMIATALSQSGSINNTIGSSGSFTIKDGSTTFLTLTQSNGYLSLAKNLSLANTTDSTLGVIYKGTDRFLHDYHGTGTDGFNTFVGVNAGNFTTGGTAAYGSYNTAVGNSALSSLTSGQNISAVGSYSLFNNTTGSFNTASGSYSLYRNTTGSSNSAFGDESLFNNTTGDNNAAFGSSLYSNTTGSSNSGFGLNSLFDNTTGNFNSAFGYWSLYCTTTGNDNSGFGNQSLYSNSSGKQNTAVGHKALWSNTTGFQNTAVGDSALYGNTGNYNTAIGYNAGSQVTSGANLTLVGIDANPSSGTTTNEITLGNGYVSTLRCNTSTISSLSDARDKRNIRDLPLGLDFLMTVKPRLFNWDRREWYEDGRPDGSKMKTEPTAGFIAQELDTAQINAQAEWLNLVLKTNPDRLEATSGNLLPIIVKALQELKVANDSLAARLTMSDRVQQQLLTELKQLKSEKTLSEAR